MLPSYAVPTPLEYFAALVRSDEGFPLLEAAASIAQDEHPMLDVPQVLEDVDWLQARLQQRIPADAGALQKLQILNRFFFSDQGFGGNINHYDDPTNSYLHTVLQTRRGIPVSLGVLWMELAQGVGLHVRGVCFPGHFMVKALLPKGQVVIDPLTGHSLSREDLLERLAPYHPHTGVVTNEGLPLGPYLQAARPREIVARILRNLQEVHRSGQDWCRLIAVQNRLIVLLPQVWTLYRDRGLIHAQCDHEEQAVRDLQTYLENTPGGNDVADIAQRLSMLRAARQ